MLSTFQIVLLSLLQGITEFLPVSSSGHLILFSIFTTFPDQGQAMDVAMHIGSIIAVMIYFSEELWKMFKGLLKSWFLPNFQDYGNRIYMYSGACSRYHLRPPGRACTRQYARDNKRPCIQERIHPPFAEIQQQRRAHNSRHARFYTKIRRSRVAHGTMAQPLRFGRRQGQARQHAPQGEKYL